MSFKKKLEQLEHISRRLHGGVCLAIAELDVIQSEGWREASQATLTTLRKILNDVDQLLLRYAAMPESWDGSAEGPRRKGAVR